MHVEFAAEDFVVLRRVVRQVSAAADIVWIGENRYRVDEVTWFLDDSDPEHVADVRLTEAGRPDHPEIVDGRESGLGRT